MSDVVANLVVKLTAENSELKTKLTEATQSIKGFSDQVDASIKNIAGAFIALKGLAEVFEFGETILKSAANFEILSHAVGIAADQLSQFAYAAKLQGVEDIATPLERMARSAGSVAEGNEKAAAAYRALNVDVKNADGTLKDSAQLFLEVADAVSSYRDGLGKTRVVQEIFGRSGADFIAFLDQGAAKIHQMQQEAIDLGVAISTSTAQAAHEVEQNVERMQAAFHGVFNRALEELLPTFEKLSDAMVGFAKDGNNTREVVDEIVFAIKTVTLFAVQVGFVFHGLGDSIGYLLAQGAHLVRLFADIALATVDPIGAVADFDATLREMASIDKDEKARSEAALKQYRETRRIILHQVTQDELDAIKAQSAASDLANQRLKDLNPSDVRQTKGLESAIEELTKLNDKLHEQVSAYGLTGTAALAYELTLGKLSAAVEVLNNGTKKQRDTALDSLLTSGKITKELHDQLEAMSARVRVGDELVDQILGTSAALDKLKANDALSKMDAELLKVTGHFAESAQAVRDLAERPIKLVLQFEADKQDLAGLKGNDLLNKVFPQLNELAAQTNEIQNRLLQSYADIEEAGKREGKSTIQILSEEAAARALAKHDLDEIFIKIEALAEASKLPEVIALAAKAREEFDKITFDAGSQIVQGTREATAALKDFESELSVIKKTDDDLTETFAKLNLARQQGTISTIDLMNAQDAATEAAIKEKYAELQTLDTIPKVGEAYDRAAAKASELRAQILGLAAQTGQLARIIRTDFEDAATSAFVSFANGTKSAREAFHSFLTDIQNRLLQLGAQHLFENIFGKLFGEGSGDVSDIVKAITGLGGSSSGAGAGISAAIAAGGVTAGTEISTAMTAAGAIVATQIAAAMSASGPGVGGLLQDAGSIWGSVGATSADEFGTSLWNLAGITGLAGGGPVRKGTPYLVGENGPELMLPGVDGAIVPSDSWGKGGVNIVNNFHIEAPKGTVSRATQGQIAASAALSMMAAGARNN